MGRVDDEQEPDAAIYQKSDPELSEKRDSSNDPDSATLSIEQPY
jgi:hypothetical protein